MNMEEIFVVIGSTCVMWVFAIYGKTFNFLFDNDTRETMNEEFGKGVGCIFGFWLIVLIFLSIDFLSEHTQLERFLIREDGNLRSTTKFGLTIFFPLVIFLTTFSKRGNLFSLWVHNIIMFVGCIFFLLWSIKVIIYNLYDWIMS